MEVLWDGEDQAKIYSPITFFLELVLESDGSKILSAVLDFLEIRKDTERTILI